MPIKLAIIGLDPIQKDWLGACAALSQTGGIEIVGAGHRTVAQARDIADPLSVPAFDDLRRMMHEAAPQILLMDRPANVTADFLSMCFSAGVGVISIGPPVNTTAEAITLSDVLATRTNQLLVSPMFSRTPGFAQGTLPEVIARPVRLISAELSAFNHAAAKGAEKDGAKQPIVRSLSILAWEAMSSLIELLGMPEAVFASVRGTILAGDEFTDIQGAAGLVLRFGDGETSSVVVTVSLSDRSPARRAMMIVAKGGTARVEDYMCEARDADGKLLDVTRYPEPVPTEVAAETIVAFLEQFSAPTSPTRGWPHRLCETAACMEAMVVSHRTGQPESPERFLQMRR